MIYLFIKYLNNYCIKRIYAVLEKLYSYAQIPVHSNRSVIFIRLYKYIYRQRKNIFLTWALFRRHQKYLRISCCFSIFYLLKVNYLGTVVQMSTVFKFVAILFLSFLSVSNTLCHYCGVVGMLELGQVLPLKD